jgi:hypothetical protein
MFKDVVTDRVCFVAHELRFNRQIVSEEAGLVVPPGSREDNGVGPPPNGGADGISGGPPPEGSGDGKTYLSHQPYLHRFAT